MLPLERFPQPLTDANFMVYRSIPKMLQAFRRVPNWQQVITSNKHMRFDEWVVEPPSVMVAFQQMLFQLLQRSLGQGLLDEDGDDLVGHLFGGAGEPLRQALEPALFRRIGHDRALAPASPGVTRIRDVGRSAALLQGRASEKQCPNCPMCPVGRIAPLPPAGETGRRSES